MVFSSLAVVADLSESSTHRGSRGVEKMSSDGNVLHAKRIARQQCRARIETPLSATVVAVYRASPGSNAGRGLKHLKNKLESPCNKHRPAAMPGAD